MNFFFLIVSRSGISFSNVFITSSSSHNLDLKKKKTFFLFCPPWKTHRCAWKMLQFDRNQQVFQILETHHVTIAFLSIIKKMSLHNNGILNQNVINIICISKWNQLSTIPLNRKKCVHFVFSRGFRDFSSELAKRKLKRNLPLLCLDIYLTGGSKLGFHEP